MHQTKLSLHLRKRNLERSESAIPTSKRQIKDDTDGQISAFGAPHLEERKIIKRTINAKPGTTNEHPNKKRDTKQATLKQLVKTSSTHENRHAVDSKVESTTLDSTTTRDTSTLKHQEPLYTEDSSTYHINATVVKLQENPSTADDMIHDSPTLCTRSSKEAATFSHEKQLINDNDTIPLLSPSTIPVSTRKTSPSTTIPENLPFPPISNRQATVGKLPSPSSVVHDKSSLSKYDNGHIIEERSILDKLVSALDITLTFHAARNIAAFFHKIQPMLRNSTCKNVTLSHLCKILFVAPELYDVEAKLLKEYGKDTEAHQVSIGSIWVIPLSGKVIQERKDLIQERSGDYFEKNKETSTIPEKELPRMDKVVDKKKWLQKATLPDRVRSVLELQNKRKAAKEEKANQPRMEPKGTAKDRAKALLDRIRNKQKQ